MGNKKKSKHNKNSTVNPPGPASNPKASDKPLVALGQTAAVTARGPAAQSEMGSNPHTSNLVPQHASVIIRKQVTMASPPQKIGGITGGKAVRLHSGNGSRLNL